MRNKRIEEIFFELKNAYKEYVNINRGQHTQDFFLTKLAEIQFDIEKINNKLEK